MRLVCSRSFGVQKLKKPKFCNNKNYIGSYIFNKHCKNKVWKFDNKYYILFRDWFSLYISKQEAVQNGIIEDYNKRFVYDDSKYGSVVLRNEAILEVESSDWEQPYIFKADNLINKLSKQLNVHEIEIANSSNTIPMQNFLNLIGEKGVIVEYF